MLADRINSYAERITADDPSRKSQVRGNLRTDVGKASMTWFTFKKCLRALGVEYLHIRFACKHIHRQSEHILAEILDDQEEEDDDDMETSKKPNSLSFFFKEVLFNLDITPVKFEDLLNLFIRRNKLDINTQNRVNIRGYLKKDLYAPRLSWQSLIKGFNFLCVTRMDLYITLTFRRGRVTHHQFSVQVSHPEEYDRGAPRKES